MVPLSAWVDKKLKELDLRQKYHISIVAIKKGSEVNAVPHADSKISAGDTLIVIGKSSDIENIK